MAHLMELDGVRPTIGDDVYLAPTAVLIGDVHIADRASVWFGAVLRADFSEIRVGAESCIQDNAVLHCAEELPTIVGDGVVVGHGAILEGCVIDDGALIGMGAIALQRSHVRARAVLAAGAVLAEGATVGDEMMAAGVPAVEKKALSGSALRWSETAADEYGRLRARYARVSDALIHD